MFLNSLSNKQKNLFIQLAIKAAEINGVVEFEEKNMLKTFAMEMDIAPIYSADNVTTEEVLNELILVSSKQELRIIIFEILGIMIADSEFDEKEEDFVNNMIYQFAVHEKEKEEMLVVLKDYLRLYNKIVGIVFD